MTPPRDCRKALVGASIARPCPFASQESRPGKCVAAASWRATNGRPYTRNKAGMQFFDGLRSGQDRSLQLSRQRGGYNKVGGNKKSHHGRWWDNSSSIHLLEFLRDRVRSRSRCNSNGVCCGRSHSILRQQTRMIARTVIEANQRAVDIKNTQNLTISSNFCAKCCRVCSCIECRHLSQLLDIVNTNRVVRIIDFAFCISSCRLRLRCHNNHTGFSNNFFAVGLVNVAGQSGDEQGGQDSQDDQDDDQLDEGEALFVFQFF